MDNLFYGELQRMSEEKTDTISIRVSEFVNATKMAEVLLAEGYEVTVRPVGVETPFAHYVEYDVKAVKNEKVYKG